MSRILNLQKLEATGHNGLPAAETDTGDLDSACSGRNCTCQQTTC